MADYYLWIKALHLIAVISWMAGLLYLPRLYVYHTGVKKAGEADKTLKIMERKLLNYIMNPAMIVTWLLGLSLLHIRPDLMQAPWMHAKLTLVVLLTGFHHMLMIYRKKFEKGENTKSDRYFRIMNEVPTIIMVVVVILVIVQPF